MLRLCPDSSAGRAALLLAGARSLNSMVGTEANPGGSKSIVSTGPLPAAHWPAAACVLTAVIASRSVQPVPSLLPPDSDVTVIVVAAAKPLTTSAAAAPSACQQNMIANPSGKPDRF